MECYLKDELNLPNLPWKEMPQDSSSQPAFGVIMKQGPTL